MKKTLTVLCLMIAVVGAGQTTRWQTLSPNTTIAKYDTIPIIYLYADTVRMGFQIEPRKIAFWDFGYEVREEDGVIPVTTENMFLKWVMQYRHITYLDHQKQPIRKSMIIFNVKNIQ